ncbi:MAG: TldD/PmbA family protein, partial [Thermoplasmata archaeon]
MDTLRDHEEELHRLLTRLERQTPFAETMAQRTRGEAVGMDRKAHRASTSPRLAGAVVRAWAGDRWVEAAASSFDPEALETAARGLEASLTSGAAHRAPPGESATTTGNAAEIPRRPMRELGLEKELEFARDIYRWTMAVKGVSNAQVSVGWWDDERLYLNTVGARCYQIVSRVRASVAAIATENGRTEFDFGAVGGIGGQEILGRMDEARAQATATSSVDLLRARTPPTGPMNVILDSGTTGTFAHESFGHGTEADQFVRNRSYLQPILGEVVAPESLTIIDDGSIPGAWGSIYFDDEGHRPGKTTLIDHGRFIGALHDRE